jgi:arylformamidase
VVEILDVTIPVRPGMVTYPGDPPVRVERFASLAAGATANVSRLELSAHAGTHVDAPLHFLDGAGAVDALELDVLIGPAEVVDATDLAGGLDVAALARLPSEAPRLLFKTRNSELWARDEVVAGAVELTPAAAREFVRRGARLVGIDYLSIGDDEVHRVLLAAGVVILESLDLRGVEPGACTLLCLPLKLAGADGAPARAVLLRP